MYTTLSIDDHDQGAATMELRAGTHYLAAPLELTAADSGLTIQTYAGDSGGTAWLSGAVLLRGATWTRDPVAISGTSGSEANVWSADLSAFPALAGVAVHSLRVGEERGVLARYPNCNPETQLCFAAPPPSPGPATPSTVTVATQWLGSSGDGYSVYTAGNGTARTFACPNASFSVGCDVEYQVYYGGEACGVFTPPVSHFCGYGGANTSSSSRVAGAVVNQTSAPHQPYADASGARFSVLHFGAWCSFAYDTAPGGYSYDAGKQEGTFAFSAGGMQCNRPDGSPGAMVIENVREELDSPGEFFFNTTTRVLTLWYNATAGTPPPDGAVAVPVLHTLVGVRGSQASPATGVALRNLGLRDTAPSVMLPHTGPSGGDWAVNRNASVVLEGVVGAEVSNSTFWRLDNAGVFLGGFARGVVIADNDFAWLGESAVVSLGDTEGGPVPGWGVDGSAGNQPRGTKLWRNFARELGIINKQSALYFQAVTDGADVRGNVAFNGARSGANFNDGFGSGSNFTENVFFNLNRETADHGPFNSWDRVAFEPRKGPENRDELSYNAMWCNYNSANGFDNDDTSTYFHIWNNVIMRGYFLKSDFGGSEIEYEDNLLIWGGQSDQFQEIPTSNNNRVTNCTILATSAGENLQRLAPCPDASNPIQFTNMDILVPAAGLEQSTVCKKPIGYWQEQGLLKTVAVKPLPASADEIVQMARNTLGF